MSEDHNRHAGQGAVLLDIGGDVGALVVTMPAEMLGVEIEIRPVGVVDTGHPHGDSHGHEHGHGHDHDHHHDDGHLLHVAVVNRPVAGGHVPSLVFPELVARSYDLFEKGHGDEVVLTVEIAAAEVTHAVWPL